MNKTVFFLAVFFSTASVAGVYKCTDASGSTSYQAKPCEKQKQAFEMNIQTGSKVDLNRLENLQQLSEQQKQEQEIEKQRLIKKAAELKKAAMAESSVTQRLIKNNPRQYSAFAIPPYNPEMLPAIVQQFENRLPEIEKFRRLAAQKALRSSQCHRVEADDLNVKSQKDQLVFKVDCSTGQSFLFNESELTD